ncbi:MAG: ATP-binding protein [Holophagaceae bacterium]|nr:ATP-binding protein [Holophagaceae bacterium]
MAAPCRLIVLTGGPGAGKTAILEVVRKDFHRGVSVLPEAASILFAGGFPRRRDAPGHRAVQRAIYHVQRELERIALDHPPELDGTHGGRARRPVILCDRGTLDGLAYWPGDPADFFTDLGTTLEAEFARYHAVIHLRTPPSDNGYNRQNPVRIETAEEAAEVDARILNVWAAHPNCTVVESTAHFLEKVQRVLTLVRAEAGETEA